MTSSFDLGAYLARIGYRGPQEPTLDVLRAIHLGHATTIPFENLNPFLGWPVLLDVDALQRKLIHEGRGGYCFEQNLLLSHALRALGFQVTGLAARVRWYVPDEVVTARGHMLLRVDLDGESFVADVGFGGLTLTAPLRLVPDVEQPTPHEPFRLRRIGDEYVIEALVRDAWQPLYRFGLQEQLLPDYEVTNWYLSNHPGSHFVTGLMAARPDADRRYALHNDALAVHRLGGETTRRTLTSVAELREVLAGTFRITVPEGKEVDERLGRLITRPVAVPSS